MTFNLKGNNSSSIGSQWIKFSLRVVNWIVNRLSLPLISLKFPLNPFFSLEFSLALFHLLPHPSTLVSPFVFGFISNQELSILEYRTYRFGCHLHGMILDSSHSHHLLLNKKMNNALVVLENNVGKSEMNRIDLTSDEINNSKNLVHNSFYKCS